MKLTLWVATMGALLAAPFSALAQQSTRPADPADPHVAVAPLVYESAIPATARSAPDHGDAAAGKDATPDKLWRTANDTVAGAPGHGGHDADALVPKGHAHAAPPASPKPADRPAADHGKHH